MQKTVNIKVKVGLKSSTIVWNSDADCIKNYRPFYNTFSKVQTQGSSYKNSHHSKKLRNKNLKPVLPYSNIAKPAKKDDKKKKL